MKTVERSEIDRKIEEYLKLPYTITVIPYEDGGYFAKVEELDGCMTEADSWEELKEMIEDAMRCWLESALEDGDEIPLPKVIEENVEKAGA